jgi:hypothetical protein
MNEQQIQAMVKLAAAEADLRSARNSKIKFEINRSRERRDAAKKEAKKLGCIMPVHEKSSKIQNIAGRVSWRNS